MRIIVQRVSAASVSVDGLVHSAIGKGLLVLAGFEHADDLAQTEWVAHKLLNLRIFDDAQQIPNLSVSEIQGEIIVVSQFTLHALTKKGNRPSYIQAARPEQAIPLYNHFVELLKMNTALKSVHTGVFGADMQVALVNDGPVTIFIDSLNRT